MDTRGQGSGWGAGGDTPDPMGSGPAVPGFMTRGLLDPADHYFRRVFTDAVRAVEAIRAVAGVDPTRVAVAGASQGGGIALAVAGLVPDLLGVMADVPFLCHIRRAGELSDRAPYTEITTYLSVHRDHVALERGSQRLDRRSLRVRSQVGSASSVQLTDATDVDRGSLAEASNTCRANLSRGIRGEPNPQNPQHRW